MIHSLKIDSDYLKAKLEGDKLFEIRNNDREYQKGDTVVYCTYPSDIRVDKHSFEITYVTGFMQKDNYVVFGEKFIGTAHL